ncbi:MAG: cytidylate kinase family protein [Bryobacteraceae bacterium]|nr:cytidylate kinase family protein [Bryobacteraceae bacterium]
MAVVTVSGEPGCRVEETARLTAQRLGLKLFTEFALRRMVEDEFGPANSLPDKAYPHLLEMILARLAVEDHLAACIPGAEFLLRGFGGALRVWLLAPAGHRAGSLMLDHRLERPQALELLEKLEKDQKEDRRRKFGRSTVSPHLFDLTLNAGTLEPDLMAALIQEAARARGIKEQGLLPADAEAAIQFRVRLQLARHRLSPPRNVSLKNRNFVHPSEEIFANLLDFYRIAWEYEPRSFPLQWDNRGNVMEAFTPDFYLPEFDLYVELTTMKQALVTRKNRKIKLLRQIYPDINIQVFYQKDFQNLIFKYGLAERAVQA